MKTICILSALALSVSLGFSAEEGKKKGPKERPNFEEIFAKKDTNNDGKLSKEEFTKGAKDSTKAEGFFAKLDKDSDGFISKEEFTKRPGKKKKEGN